MVDSPGSLDLCFITTASPDDVAAHLRDEGGVPITEGPVPKKTGALGAMTSYYCRDPPEGNLVEIASYPS